MTNREAGINVVREMMGDQAGPGQGAQRSHGCGRRRIEPADSQAPNIFAAIIELGSRTGDGEAQNLHRSDERESLLL